MKSPKKATVFTRISKIFSQSPILKHGVPPSHCSSSDTRSAQTVLRGSAFGFYPKTVFPVCGRRGGSVARGNFRHSQETLAENARQKKPLARNARKKRSQETLAENARQKKPLARNARRKRSPKKAARQKKPLARNARKIRSQKNARPKNARPKNAASQKNRAPFSRRAA